MKKIFFSTTLVLLVALAAFPIHAQDEHRSERGNIMHARACLCMLFVVEIGVAFFTAYAAARSLAED